MITENRVIKNRFFLLFIFSATLFASCNQKVVFEEKYVFDSHQWDNNNIVSFSPEISDTAQSFSMGISLKHGGDYPYSNLWLFISVENDFDTIIRDTVELFVAQPSGKWIGKKQGSNYEVTAFYKQKMKATASSKYKFLFEQGMREDILEDVRSLEFWIIED